MQRLRPVVVVVLDADTRERIRAKHKILHRGSHSRVHIHCNHGSLLKSCLGQYIKLLLLDLRPTMTDTCLPTTRGHQRRGRREIEYLNEGMQNMKSSAKRRAQRVDVRRQLRENDWTVRDFVSYLHDDSDTDSDGKCTPATLPPTPPTQPPPKLLPVPRPELVPAPLPLSLPSTASIDDDNCPNSCGKPGCHCSCSYSFSVDDDADDDDVPLPPSLTTIE